MADRRATKDHYERENEQAERLVRPAPKIKPPRHDLRREEMETDSDPDLDSKDKDLSENYKDVGGSVSARVLSRWRTADADRANLVKVKHKETGHTTYVTKETLKEKGGDYEVLQNEEDDGGPVEDPTQAEPKVAPPKSEPTKEETPKPEGGAQEAPVSQRKKEEEVLNRLKDLHSELADPGLQALGNDLINPNSVLGTWPGDTPIQKMPKQLMDPEKFPVLKKYRTIDDLRKDLKSQKHLKKVEKQLHDKWKAEGGAPAGEAKPAAPGADPAKQKAMADAGKQIRELAEKDPALKTVIHQLDGQDSNTLYQLRKQIDPTEDISKSMPGLPENIKTLGDVVDAVKATQPGTDKKEAPEAAPEEKDDAVQKLVETLQKALGGNESKDEARGLHPDDKAETESFVKDKKHESPEFKEWANAQSDTRAAKDGTPLFYDEKRKKHVPFNELTLDEQYGLKNEFERGQTVKANIEPLKAKAAEDRHVANALQDLANPDSELSQAIEKLGDKGRLQDIKKSIPELRTLDLPPGVQSVGDLIDAAEEIHKKPPEPKRRAVTPEEKDKAERQIIEQFPLEVAERLLDSDPPIHPDDVHDLVETYNTAKSHANDKELVDMVRDGGYETDPARVRPPAKGLNRHGQKVPFGELHPKEQAEALQKHRMFVMGMSLAARERAVERLQKKTNAPTELLGAIADFTFRQKPDESDEDKTTRATQAAKNLFADAVKRGLMSDDSDKYARWQHKREKLIEKHEQIAKQNDEEYDPDQDTDLPPPPAPDPIEPGQFKKLLAQLQDEPAAQHLAVGYAQATDYLRARSKFLEQGSDDAMSEHDSPEHIAKQLKNMGKFFDEASKKYPDDMKDVVPAKDTLRNQVVDRVRRLSPEKFPIVKKLVQEQEYDEYEEKLAKHEKAQKAYEKALVKSRVKGSPYRESQPKPPEPPKEPEGYLRSRGTDKARGKHEKELFDRYREDMGIQHPGKTASIVWRVAERSLMFSSCTALKTMGDPLSSRVAERAKNSVYWGVAPYPKGHEGFAPYTKWEQVHQRDLGDKDFDVILKSAREWLKAPVLSNAVEGVYRDTQLRAALDLALRSCENGKYSVGLQPPLYNMLLAKLGGASQTETLLTDRSNIRGPITAAAHPGELHELEAILKKHGYDPKDAKKLNDEGMGPEELEHRIKSTKPGGIGSLEYTHRIHKTKTGSESPYAPSGEENPMKASALIRALAAKYASSNTVVAYDLIDLSEKVAQEEQGQGQGQQQEPKQAGEVPPQFLEHMKKKEDGGEEKKEEGQGQQKDASYQALRSSVIKMAHANPHLREAYRPLLETIKKLG